MARAQGAVVQLDHRSFSGREDEFAEAARLKKAMIRWGLGAGAAAGVFAGYPSASGMTTYALGGMLISSWIVYSVAFLISVEFSTIVLRSFMVLSFLVTC